MRAHTEQRRMWCYEPKAHLVTNEQGQPLVHITFYCEDLDELTDEEAFKLYMEPIEAKRLGLELTRVGQDGIEAEIKRERRELAKSGFSLQPQENTSMKTKELPIYRCTESQYHHLRDETCGGICLSCGEFVYDGVEPDAERYECDLCGRSTVYGIEQALILGQLDIIADADNPVHEESDYLD